MKSFIRAMALAAGGALAATVPEFPRAQGATETVKFAWQSQNGSRNELSREFAKLYASLLEQFDAGNRVPTTKVTVPEGKSIGAVLREQGLFDGAYEPKQLDIFVCKLNKICRVHRGPSGDRNADDAVVSWRLLPNDEILVPAFKFEPVILHRPYQKRSKDSLRKIVVVDRGGCVEFDLACEHYLRNLNRRIELHDWYEGEIIVPTKAYRAQIEIITPIKPKPAAAVAPVPVAAPAAAAATAVPAAAPQPIERNRAMAETVREPKPEAKAVAPVYERSTAGTRSFSAPADPDLEVRRNVLQQSPGLQRQVSPAPSQVILHSNHEKPAPMKGSRERLLKLIGMPTKLPQFGSTHVVVFDNLLDDGHCLLRTVAIFDRAGKPAPRTQTKCGEWGAALRGQDHGTHVVGLIGAIDDPRLGRGINPTADLTFVEVNPDEFMRRDYLMRVSDVLRKLYRSSDAPDVVNLSLEYLLPEAQGTLDPFRDEIRAQVRNTLFVVSAGNSSTALQSSGNCDVRPACHGGPNVLTVAALNLDQGQPDLAPGSNYGDRVHIGAPGVDVVSTISQNKIGAMSGTSQAAPIVAGAASLLYAYNRRLQPAQVKNRLIYTSDLPSNLHNKLIGGRLNIERALNLDKAVVQTKTERFEGALAEYDTVVFFTDFESKRDFDVSIRQIKRLAYDKARDLYTVFYFEHGATDSTELRKRFVSLRNSGRHYSFAIPAEQADAPDRRVRVRIRDITDYVAAISL